MPDGRDAVTVRVVNGIGELSRDGWNACAGDGNPFVGYDFLEALETSESVGSESGWLPRHLVIEDGGGELAAAAPMYVKGHSYGEYVFDHAWADAFMRAGGRYYPKLQVAVPFSPVAGPRFLARPGPGRDALLDALIAGAIEATRQMGVSSLHVTFVEEAQARRAEAAGMLLRLGYQFHWQNDGYASFDDFLGALVSRKRKAIRKERRQVAEAGVELLPLTGADIKPEHWDVFYRFYIDTYDRKWGYPYLTRGFFERLSERMADRTVLIMARADGDYVAGALNLLGDDAIYGRNWGCAGHYKFLHFEACYYQAIEFAIGHGLQRVEAGTQGPHKVQRGYLPRLTYSAHWIANESFREAIDDYLSRERPAVEQEARLYESESPFRADSR